MKVFSIVVIFGGMVSFSAQASLWKCDESFWKESPQLEDGIFSATIQTDCRVEAKRKDGIAWLYQKLQKEYQKKEKYEIHQGPIPLRKGNLEGLKYDLTDKLNEEDSDLAIRQNVELFTDLVSELFYHTQSTDIQASGTAAYLKEVFFGTEVRALPDAYEVRLQNQVRIERPWFALGFLFKPMSASITESKFEIARNKLMEHLLKE